MLRKEETKYYCPNCQNTNKRLFFQIKEELKCRRCLRYTQVLKKPKHIKIKVPHLNLNYNLTIKQKKASDFLVKNWLNQKSSAIDAVCGAGKSEIILKVIYIAIKNGQTVGITTPRKDLVLELEEKFQQFIKNIKITSIYGGKTKDLEGTLFILTTHQLYRFKSFFDLLVVDEVDAFPFYNNIVLRQHLKKAGKGILVFLSATMPETIINNENIEKFTINKRYHNYPIPVPLFKRSLLKIRRVKKIVKQYPNKVILVFFPTIKQLEKYSKKFKVNHLKIHSKIKDKKKMFEKIIKLKKGIVFTTNILERGVTIKGAQVIVFDANHFIFDIKTLIQISGRVGRKLSEPDGHIYFLANIKTKKIKEVIRNIESKNRTK